MNRTGKGRRLGTARGVGLTLAGLAALAQCSTAAPSRGQATAVFPSGAEFGLEIAADAAARARGYMERERVGPQDGMLFVFEASGIYPFWMKRCRVALDIVWLDEQWRVVHVAHRVPPCPSTGDCPQVTPPGAARYVIEVAAGRAGEEGLAAGDRIVVLGDPPPGR